MEEEKEEGQGSLKLSDQVFALIASKEVLQVEGVVGMSGGIVENVSSIFSRGDKLKGIKVQAGEEGVTFDISIIVEYGQNIPTLADRIKQRVSSAINQMTGLQCLAINLFVEGIQLPAQSKRAALEEPKEA